MSLVVQFSYGLCHFSALSLTYVKGKSYNKLARTKCCPHVKVCASESSLFDVSGALFSGCESFTDKNCLVSCASILD